VSLFLDHNQLQKFYDSSSNKEFQTLVRAHIVAVPGQRLNTHFRQIDDGQTDIFLESKSEVLGVIGSFYKAQNVIKKPVLNPERKPRLLSLNLGSFGLNSAVQVKGEEYSFLREKFLKYLEKQLQTTLILNLQDVPQDQELFDSVNKLGFDIYFIPSSIYSEGDFSQRPNCGQAVFINQNLSHFDLKILNISLSFHHGGFFDYHKCFKKYKSEDYLQKPLTLYFTFQNASLNQLYHISNIYNSAFSTVANRFKNTMESIEILDKMLRQLTQKSPNSELIVRFTGDFNFYGYDTQVGPLGLSAEPFAHLPAVFWAVLKGFRPWLLFSQKTIFNKAHNHLNQNEVDKVANWLHQHGFSMSTDGFGRLNQSKTVMVNEFAPSFVKPIFKGSGTSWILDLCIYPTWTSKFNIWYDSEPYGDIDHKTMIAQL
jgi:hypothetical protein